MFFTVSSHFHVTVQLLLQSHKFITMTLTL